MSVQDKFVVDEFDDVTPWEVVFVDAEGFHLLVEQFVLERDVGKGLIRLGSLSCCLWLWRRLLYVVLAGALLKRSISLLEYGGVLPETFGELLVDGLDVSLSFDGLCKSLLENIQLVIEGECFDLFCHLLVLNIDAVGVGVDEEGQSLVLSCQVEMFGETDVSQVFIDFLFEGVDETLVVCCVE